METVSANIQILPISGDETAKFTAYSSAVQKVVVMVNAGILGLLQLMNNHSSIFETNKASILCFLVLVLFYAVFRVREASYGQLRVGLVARLVGNASHLFGILAALVLISIVCVPFALILLILWFLWLCVVVYNTLNEFIIYSETNRSGTTSPYLSPV